MKILIESDVFDIVDRIKEIDDGYYICFDSCREVYELHNYKQKNSYCLTIPYNQLDDRIIDLINTTSSANIDEIMSQIDADNDKISANNNRIMKDNSDYMLREIYSFANNSSKNFQSSEAFSTSWR